MPIAFDRTISLIGMPGCGKSTIGKALKEILGVPFFDSDRVIEESKGFKVSTIIDTHGIEYFRNLEQNTIHDLLKNSPFILATGGGAPTIPDTFEILKEYSLCIYINISLDYLQQRLEEDAGDRPLLGEPGALERLYAERSPIYAQAREHVNIENGETVNTSVEKCLDLIKA